MSKRPAFRVICAGLAVPLLGGMLAVVIPLLGTTTVAGAQPNPPGGAIIVNNGSYSNQGVLPGGCATPDDTTIGAAVTAAGADSIIYVCAGTYNESVTVNKTISLDGAEFGVNAVGRTGEPETTITGSGGVSFTAGATGDTVSGFTMNSYTGGVGEIRAASVGSGWTFTDNIIDASQGGIYFNTNDVATPSATTISDNAFTQATSHSEGGSGDYGQAILLWGKTGNNVSISGNDFSDLSGPGAAINTTGSGAGPDTNCNNNTASTLSQGLQISSNTFEDNGANSTGENFLAMFCTDGAQVTANTARITDNDDPFAETVIYLGGANPSATVSGNTLSGVTDGGAYNQFTLGNTQVAGVDVNSNSYPSGSGATVSGNTISGLNFGVDIRNTPPSAVTVTDNTITDSVTDGIIVKAGGASESVSDNYVAGSGTDDCADLTTGAGTAGTNDTWTNNIGATSSPSGLCGKASTGANTTVNDASTSAAWSGSEVTGASAYDTSAVTGEQDAVAPTGTVSYTLFDTSTCSDAGTSAGSALSLGSSSSTEGPLAVGNYGFEATYSGDSHYTGSTSACEPFSVGQAAGGIATTVDDAATNAAWTGGEAAGASAYDTSSVTGEQGGIVPGGTVSYTYFTNSTCTAGSTPAGSSLALGSHSTTEGPLAAGNYGFEATYSGDSNYSGATGACESFSTGKAASGVSTTVDDAATHATWSGSEGTGSSAYDTSAITGEVDSIAPTGTVSYTYFTNNTCTAGSTPAGSTLALGSHSTTEGPLSTGSYGFEASYSGDANYSSSTGPCESFSVGRGTSPTKTTPTDSTIVLTLNQADTDVATVTGNAGGGSPTGTMTFYECGAFSVPTPCTSMSNPVGGAVSLSPASGNTATATSASFTPNAVGYWCFASYYSGDANYNTSSDATVDECVNVEGPLSLITSSLPSATRGTSYSTTLVARGGTQPYRWTHGHLPRGLSLNRTTGVLAGTPLGHGTYTVTIHVRDMSHPHQIVTKHFTLVINL